MVDYATVWVGPSVHRAPFDPCGELVPLPNLNGSYHTSAGSNPATGNPDAAVFDTHSLLSEGDVLPAAAKGAGPAAGGDGRRAASGGSQFEESRREGRRV